jgi:hypothetical protein
MFSSRWIGLLLGIVLVGGAERAAALSDTPDARVPKVMGTSVGAIVQSGNRIYIGGSFTSIGGVSRSNLAAIDAVTGQVDPAWNPSLNDRVYALAVSGGRVYAAGRFTMVNGNVARNCVAAFPLADGKTSATATAWNPKLTFSIPSNPYNITSVFALAVSSSTLYLGGSFATVNGVARNGLAAVKADDGVNTGTLDAAWNPMSTMGSRWLGVSSLAVTPARVYAYALGMTYLDPQALLAVEPANGVNTGARDSAWRPSLHYCEATAVRNYAGLQHGSAFTALLVQGNRLYVGGNFDRIDTTSRTAVAALNLADGRTSATMDAAWNPVLDFKRMGGGVSALTVANSRLIVGGNYSIDTGLAQYDGLAALSLADGAAPATLDTSWNPKPELTKYGSVASPGGWLYALMPSANGLLAGGTFVKIKGWNVNALVGFDSTLPVALSAFSAE